MIIFLYGEDTCRLKRKKEEIVSQYKKTHKRGLGFKYFDCEDKYPGDIFREIEDQSNQRSMFEEKKLVVIANFFQDKAFKEKLLASLDSFLKSSDVFLLIEAGKIRAQDSLLKSLKAKAKCQEFLLLKGEKLKNWVREEAALYKGRIESGALDKLVEYVGNDLWRMENEIKKLAVFRKGEEIKKEDVEFQVNSKIETDIFKAIDALADKNKKTAFSLLYKHLEKGDSPLYLLSMINYQFRNLLIVKDFIEKNNSYGSVLKKSGLHPFVAKKSFYQCQKFSLPDLKKIARKIFQADLNIKTGKVEAGTALDLLVAEI